MKPVRVLAANHPRLLRELVMATIADQPGIELVGKGRNESDLADIVEPVQPDVLIVAMNETEKRLGQCGFLLWRHPEMRPAKRGKHLPPILSTAKQTPAPKTSAQRLLPDSPGNNYRFVSTTWPGRVAFQAGGCSGGRGVTVPTSSEVREMASEHGRAKKRNNAIVALLSSARSSAQLLSTGFLATLADRSRDWLVWGNAFEYAYHRWMLHRRKSSFAKGHLEHHGTIGAPEEAEHVTLGRSPFHIALLFASNGVFVMVVDLLLGLGLVPGIFVGWTVYLIAAEEIHWRIHMEGWLPPGLGFARAYHMSHHDIPNTRYNVFYPCAISCWEIAGSRAPATA